MTMSVHLFVLACACACALGITDIPPPTSYVDSKRAVDELWNTLQENVLSMEGDIPLLNDPRRHYAEIFYVIHYEAISQSGCVRRNYSEEYLTTLNESAPEAINNPGAVIEEFQEFSKKFQAKTKEIQELILDCIPQITNCDESIDKQVKENPELYDPQIKILILAAEAASKLQNKAAKFDEVANNLAAIEFVIKAADDLEEVTIAVSNLYRNLNQWNPVQSC